MRTELHIDIFTATISQLLFACTCYGRLAKVRLKEDVVQSTVDKLATSSYLLPTIKTGKFKFIHTV